MPQLAAASSRDRPSKTSAIASIRRAASASRVRAASRRKSPADRSRRVIATAMSASAPGQWRSESRRPPKRGHIRVIGQGAWYYTAGGADAEARAANLRALNDAAVALRRAGHVPVIGVNMALPMIEAAGGTDAAYDEIMMPLSLALADRCDACLRVGGPSKGADDEVERFAATGRH